MNTDAHDERPAPGSRQAFTELMDSIRRLSDQDRTRAQEQADAAVLGFEAYALGQEYLERGDLDGALRWLRIAADHDVPGAQRLLEDTVLRTALDDAHRNAAQILARAREQTRPPRTPAPADTGAASRTPAGATPYSMQTNTGRHLALVLVAASSECEVGSLYPAYRYLTDRYGSHRRHNDVQGPQGPVYSLLQCLQSLVPSSTNPGRDPLSFPGWNLLYYAGHGLRESAPTHRYGYSDTYYRPGGPHRTAPHPDGPDSPVRTPAAMDHGKCSVETLLSTYTPRSGDGERWIMVLDACISAAAQPPGVPAPQILPAPGRVEGS